MRSYLPSVADASRMAEFPAAGTPAGTVVVRAAGLRIQGMTVTAVDAGPSAGEPAVFCRPVVTAPAVVRRDGTVLADAWLPDLVRLGELEAHLGDGAIEAAVDAAVAAGRLKPRQRRRIMSYPLVIRLMIAMTLMPDASYREALARLAGLLADIPFPLEWHVPTGKVVTDWRLPVPPDVMESLFWQAAGPLIADDEPSAVMLAALGAVLGQAGAGEQTLLKRLVRRHPGLFAGRVTCFDRNFPGYDLITAILQAGGHVIARVKEGISLPSGGPHHGWLPDGSRMTWLNAPSGKKQDRLPVRAAEHNVILPSGDGKEEPSETCTVITTLLDHEAAPADQVRGTYLTRWSASETTFGEDKSTITGAGNRTSGPVLRSGSPRLVIQEAWAWLTATQLVRASEAAALRTEATAARALRRRNQREVTADEESFTAALRHAIRSMTSTQATASSSLNALAAAADAAARAALHTLNVPGRQRHSPRAQKARPKFPHAAATKTTVTGKPQVTAFTPGFS